MGTWIGYQPDPAFLLQCPKDVQRLFSGSTLYWGRQTARRLGEAVGERSTRERAQRPAAKL